MFDVLLSCIVWLLIIILYTPSFHGLLLIITLYTPSFHGLLLIIILYTPSFHGLLLIIILYTPSFHGLDHDAFFHSGVMLPFHLVYIYKKNKSLC